MSSSPLVAVNLHDQISIGGKARQVDCKRSEHQGRACEREGSADPKKMFALIEDTFAELRA